MLIDNISSCQELDNVLNKNYQKNILYFYSNRCNTCQELDLELNNFLIKNNNKKIQFIKINIEDSPEIVKNLDITTYPIFRIYNKNVLSREIFGTYSNILEILEKCLN